MNQYMDKNHDEVMTALYEVAGQIRLLNVDGVTVNGMMRIGKALEGIHDTLDKILTNLTKGDTKK